MKKTILSFFACVVFTVVFTGCTKNLFPDKSTYNVTDGSSSPIPMSAVCYKNSISFIHETMEYANFKVKGPFPTTPPPCKKGYCHYLLFSSTNGHYALTIEDNKIPIELIAIKVDETFTKELLKSPNHQFKLNQ